MNHDEMFDVFTYMMTHKIPNVKIIYIDGVPNLNFNWHQESFDRGTGFCYDRYEDIMPILKALAAKQEAYEAYKKAITD